MMSPKNSKKSLAVYIQEPNVLTLLQAGKMDPWRTENSIWCDVSRGEGFMNPKYNCTVSCPKKSTNPPSQFFDT